MPQPKEAPESTCKTIGIDLTFDERIVLLQILPVAGHITNLRLIRELRESLEPSGAEEERFKVRYEDAILRWDPKVSAKAEPKRFDLAPRIYTLIEEAIERLNKNQKLPLAAVSLYDKFCEKNAEPGA